MNPHGDGGSPDDPRYHPSEADFHNVAPRTREERLASNDKDALEKMRLDHRRGGHARFDGSKNPLLPDEGSLSFMSEAERFGTDAAGEEFDKRQRKLLEKEVRDARCSTVPGIGARVHLACLLLKLSCPPWRASCVCERLTKGSTTSQRARYIYHPLQKAAQAVRMRRCEAFVIRGAFAPCLRVPCARVRQAWLMERQPPRPRPCIGNTNLFSVHRRVFHCESCTCTRAAFFLGRTSSGAHPTGDTHSRPHTASHHCAPSRLVAPIPAPFTKIAPRMTAPLPFQTASLKAKHSQYETHDRHHLPTLTQP